MDLEIRFKNEPKTPALVYLKNVDSLSETELRDLKYVCDQALSSHQHALVENENIRLNLKLEYDFLDKKDILNRIFNGTSAKPDFDFADSVNKKDLQKTLKARINFHYKNTNEYRKCCNNEKCCEK